MGAGKFNLTAYVEQAKEAKKEENSGFKATTICDEFNPAAVQMRYSKRGPFNEFKDPITILVGLDVTGSMDIIPKSLLEGSLGNLMVDLKKTYNRPNENLQISFAGIGDAKSDVAPLQVTHFESDNRFAKQLQKIWLEGGGGANGGESYNLLWWYAANKTHLNYVQQDKRKGILITIGDDNVHPVLTAGEIQTWLDSKYDGKDISNQLLLKAVQAQYDVYHIVITDGQAYQYDHLKQVYKTKQQNIEENKRWEDLLGKDNVLNVKSTGVAEAIASIIKRHRPLEKLEMANLTEEEWEKKNKENLTDKQWVEVLGYTLCPLTRKFMDHPVDWNNSKKAYERIAVENYVQQYGKDPLSQKKITLSELVLKPNLNIAQLCENYKPYFDALPETRKELLVNLALPLETTESSKNHSAFFSNNNNNNNNSKNESSQITKKFAEMQLSLICPITQEIMTDPVILTATGQTYERKAIEEWLEKNNTDPSTGLALTARTLVPNIALRGLCEAARDTKVQQP